jgi:hypothetical protein
MTRTLDDLRGALHQEADAAAYPDVDALVAGARRRVVASRRRRLAVLGAATAAVLVVGGLAVTRPAHKALPQPADRGPFTVSASREDFPEYQEGMKLLTVVDAPMLERTKGSIIVPTTPGRRLGVLMTCTPDHSDNPGNVSNNSDNNWNEWNDRMLAKFTAPGGTGHGICLTPAMGGYDLIGIATASRTTVLADVFVNHEPAPSLPTLFKDAKIHVAIYESVPWEDYSFPPRPADLETSDQYAWSSEPGTVRVLGPKTAQEANKPITFTQPADPKLILKLQIRGPGRMRVLLNGVDISRQIAGSYDLTQDKFISFWEYNGRGFGFPFDIAPFGTSATMPPPLKPGTPVTVTIIPQDFQGPDWRISVQPNPPSGG